MFRRVVTPAAKFWICKRAPIVTLEAMEVLGGSGYIEESIMPRLYREAPVNSIWEGSGNIMCLDVLRAIERTPKAADVLRAGTRRRRCAPEGLRRAGCKSAWRAADRNDESQARVLVRDLVLALAGRAADQACAGRGGGRVLRVAAWRRGRRLPSARCRAGSICARIAERAAPLN